MSYDLYIEKPKGDEVTQLRLLVANGAPLPDYLSLIHGQFEKKRNNPPSAAILTSILISNCGFCDRLDLIHPVFQTWPPFPPAPGSCN